jgi:purine nucleosidase/pyrimidine-specific ribonucleoside hydrolase
VPTGPITNIARLVEDAPEVRAKIREIVWMGGSAERGNRTPYAEFNAWVDPEAFEIVLACGVPFTLVGLHVTHEALATPEIIERVAAIGTPLAETCRAWLEFFADRYRRLFAIEPPMHDPCALAIALDPGIARTVDAFVAAETTGRWTRGATVIDLDHRLGREPNARVAMSIDVDRFWSRMIAAIAALPAA